MHMLISVMLIIVGIIHLLPISGLLGSERLNALYGTEINDINLTILMRHRAILFGLLGTFILIAAFSPKLQAAALGAGFISIVSFLWLTWTSPGYNEQVARVVKADLVALICLFIASIAYSIAYLHH